MHALNLKNGSVVIVTHLESPVDPREYVTCMTYGPFVEKVMNGKTTEQCIWIEGVLYVVKGVLIINLKDGRCHSHRSIHTPLKANACANEWGLAAVNFASLTDTDWYVT
jgi:hypothetical protein